MYTISGRQLLIYEYIFSQSKDKLINEATEACENLSIVINEHIHDKTNRETMFPWKTETLPDRGDDLDEIKAEARRLFQKLIGEELNRCLQLYGVQSIQEGLMKKLQRETDGIRKAQFGLEQLLQEPETMDDRDPESIDDIILLLNIDDDELNKGAIAVIAISSPVWFPLALVGGLIGIPVALTVFAIKDKIQVDNYKRNKEKYLNKWWSEVLDSHTEASLNIWLNEKVFGAFFKQLHKLFDEKLPQTIIGCRKLFDNLQNDMRSAELIRERYQPKLVECNRILADLKVVSS